MIDNSVIQVEFMLDGTNDIHGLWAHMADVLIIPILVTMILTGER